VTWQPIAASHSQSIFPPHHLGAHQGCPCCLQSHPRLSGCRRPRSVLGHGQRMHHCCRWRCEAHGAKEKVGCLTRNLMCLWKSRTKRRQPTLPHSCLYSLPLRQLYYLYYFIRATTQPLFHMTTSAWVKACLGLFLSFSPFCRTSPCIAWLFISLTSYNFGLCSPM